MPLNASTHPRRHLVLVLPQEQILSMFLPFLAVLHILASYQPQHIKPHGRRYENQHVPRYFWFDIYVVAAQLTMEKKENAAAAFMVARFAM